jgi:hypothetical protein
MKSGVDMKVHCVLCDEKMVYLPPKSTQNQTEDFLFQCFKCGRIVACKENDTWFELDKEEKTAI